MHLLSLYDEYVINNFYVSLDYYCNCKGFSNALLIRTYGGALKAKYLMTFLN